MPTIFTNTKIAVCVPTRPVPNAKKMDILSQFPRPATYPVSAIVIDPCQRSGFIFSRRKFDVGIFRKSSFRAVKSRNLFVGTQAAATVEAPVLVMMRIFDGGSSRARMAQTQTQTCVDSCKEITGKFQIKAKVEGMSLRYFENKWTAQSFGPTTLGVITSQEADQDPPLVILTHIYIIRQLTTDRNRLSPHWYISWLAIAYSKLLKGLVATTFNSWGRQHQL